jgi:ActR/RegA family two-component response regulator
MLDIVATAKKRVILVEDDDAYRYVLAREMRVYGKLEVIDVRLAMEALDYLDRDPTIRKAVIDLHMPTRTLTGLALARMMRHRNQEARVVLMTGHPDYLAIDEAKQFGGVLFKRTDMAALVADIHDRLGHGAASPAARGSGAIDAICRR